MKEALQTLNLTPAKPQNYSLNYVKRLTLGPSISRQAILKSRTKISGNARR